jgi:hypothetical protein
VRSLSIDHFLDCSAAVLTIEKPHFFYPIEIPICYSEFVKSSIFPPISLDHQRRYPAREFGRPVSCTKRNLQPHVLTISWTQNYFSIEITVQIVIQLDCTAYSSGEKKITILICDHHLIISYRNYNFTLKLEYFYFFLVDLNRNLCEYCGYISESKVNINFFIIPRY